MDTLDKLTLLRETYSDPSELYKILGKPLIIALTQHQKRLERYNKDLSKFEAIYQRDSDSFFAEFEPGNLGDNMDFFEWAGLYELRENILDKIGKLEEVIGSENP